MLGIGFTCRTKSDKGRCASYAPLFGQASRLHQHRSIRLRQHDPFCRRPSRDHALAGFLGLIEREATDRRLGLSTNAVLGFARAVPMRQKETARLVDLLFE